MNALPRFHVVASPWLADLLTHLWQSTAVAVAILLLLALGRRLSARTRRTLGWIAVAKFALPVAWLAALARGGSGPAPATTLTDAVSWSAEFTPTALLAAAPVSEWAPPVWLWPWLGGVWAAVAAGLLARWAIRAVRVRRDLLAHARPVDETVAREVAAAAARVGLRAAPRCVEGEPDHGPGALGILSPVLVLPRGLMGGLTPAESAAILVHECVHMRRRDNFWSAVRALFVGVLWFNPIAWLLNRVLALETEKSCDERVLEITGDADNYASGIVASVRHTLGVMRPGFAAATTPPVVARLTHILSYPAKPDRPALRWTAIAAALVVVALGGRAGSIAATAPAAAADGSKAAAAPAAASKPGYKIGKITITFTSPASIGEAEVRAAMQLRDGGEFNEAALDRDVRAIHRLGAFKSVEVKHEAAGDSTFNLLVELTPKPAVASHPGDREALEALAERFKPTRILDISSKRQLYIHHQGYGVGSRFAATFNDQDYELELVAIEPTHYTLRLRGEELVRPLDPSTRPYKIGSGSVVFRSDADPAANPAAGPDFLTQFNPGTLTLSGGAGANTGVTFDVPAKAPAPGKAQIAPRTVQEELNDAQQQLAAANAELKRMRDERDAARAKQQETGAAPAAPAPGAVVPEKPEPRPMITRPIAAGIPRIEFETVHDGMRVFEISELDQTPVPRFQARPQYPFDMRRQKIGGEVVVDFIINVKGEVVNAYAVRSSREEFEASAVQAVSKWRFKPGRKAGREVPTHMQMPIVFTVNE